MRIRSIKPEFWRSDDIAKHSVETRLVFIGLWNYADDYGVGRDHERLIATDLFPLEDYAVGVKRVSNGMAELEIGGQILRYKGADGADYFYIVAWNTHQTISRKSKSKQPLPTSDDYVKAGRSHDDYMRTHANSTKEQGTGNREQGTGIANTPPVEPRSGKAPKSRAVPLPDDWEPQESKRAEWTQKGLDWKHEAQQMREWAAANGVTRINWDAQFNNWMGKARPSKVAAVKSGNYNGRVWQE